MNLPNDWIKIARRCFANGCPNGALLGWDTERFFQELKSICPNQHVRNLTDFNYSYCNKYEIVPIQLPESERLFEATVSFSFICNAFSFHWTSYSIDKKRGKVVADSCLPLGIDNPRQQISKFAKESGFYEIEGPWMDLEIEGIELELADTATLGKCLFDDF